MKYTYIKSKDELLAYLKRFEDVKHQVIALDIEAELNRHAYGERLCLIQIFDGVNKVLIDPFEIDNHTLRILFENKNILKVIYDASSDSSLMKNAYAIEIKSILDLRPAVDILDYEKKDLHSVIASELGINLTEKSKYQKYNWTRRPIDKQAISYALNDVIHLLRLKDAIFKKLCSRKLLDLFWLKNLQIQDKDYTRDSRNRYTKIKGYHTLTGKERGTLRKVFDVRDKYARLHNMPPHNIIKATDLINIAKDAECIDGLRFPKRFNNDLVQKIVHELKSVARPDTPGGG